MEKMRNVYKVNDLLIDLDQIVMVGEVKNDDIGFKIFTCDDPSKPIMLTPFYIEGSYIAEWHEMYLKHNPGSADDWTETAEYVAANAAFEETARFKALVLRNEFIEAWMLAPEEHSDGHRT